MIKVTTVRTSAPTVRERTIGMIYRAPPAPPPEAGRAEAAARDAGKTLARDKTLAKGKTWRIS
jgi:hypothetical protein